LDHRELRGARARDPGDVIVAAFVLGRVWILLREATRLSDTLVERNARLQQLAHIVESTGDAVLGTTLDKTITAWNAGAEMIGRSVETLAPGDLLRDQEGHRAELDRTGGVIEYETQRTHKSGRLVAVQTTLSPIRNANGEAIGVSAIYRDISARKQLEAERERRLAAEHSARIESERARKALVEQNERLRDLDRLKEDFVASVSHELRTPLTSIRGYLELVLDGEAGTLNDEQTRFLCVAQRNSERLLRLVGDLLFVAQVEAGKIGLEKRRVELQALAEEAVDAARPTAEEKEIQLSLSAEPIAALHADPARLAQVLDNLVSNAIKFTPAGGRVDVKTFADERGAIVEVSDTGMGISREDQGQLFQRFFRTAAATDGAIQGTGLGLAIVKAIVESHGGDVSVESDGAVGTTFRVVLPLTAPAEFAPLVLEAAL
jgi:PAS domain S-box-containing protein